VEEEQVEKPTYVEEAASLFNLTNENRHCTSRGSVATISARVAAGGRRKGRRRGVDRAEREIHGSFFRGDTIELKLL
jgi:hypothetical protein